MSKVIAFTGGSYAGKTTTMDILKKDLENEGHKVVILGENIREHLDTMHKSIDEVRSDSNLYMQLQDMIVRDKMLREDNALDDDSDIIYLEDRAITDSLFYIENYVNKTDLTEENVELLCKLQYDVYMQATKLNDKYTSVLMFMPIENDINGTDIYRTSNINNLKYYECRAIGLLNKHFFSNKLYSINLNTDNIDSVVDNIKKLINHA